MQPLGTPCWLDLQTDAGTARPFYAALLGWTFEELGDGWAMALVNGAPVAAIGPGEPRGWQIFLQTDDIDATVGAALESGGTVPRMPGDVGDMGRAAQIVGPHGVEMGLWQAGTHTGFATTGTPGTPVWFEANTWNATGTRDFFAALFALEHQKMDGMDYHTLHADDRPRWGVLQMTDEWKGMDPSTMAYFHVSDIETASAQVDALGGKVMHGPFTTPFGQLSVCMDPLGTAFSLQATTNAG